MGRSESNLINSRSLLSSGSPVESPSCRLRRALSNAAKPQYSLGRSSSGPPTVHRHSLSQETQNKPMCRLRSAESLFVFRSSRSSVHHRDSLGAALSHHHYHHHGASGGPNAEFACSDEWPATKSSSTTSSSPTSPAPITAVQRAMMKARTERFARLNIKYKNDCGRTVTIAMSSAIHHDQKSNRILNVTIPCYGLAVLERSENIEWIDQKGAIYFIS